MQPSTPAGLGPQSQPRPPAEGECIALQYDPQRGRWAPVAVSIFELPHDAIGLAAAACFFRRPPHPFCGKPRCRKGISIGLVFRWIVTGRLRGWRVGREWLVSRGDVLAFAQSE